MTQTFEEANAALRQAVGSRIAAVAAGKPAEKWYDPQDEDSPTIMEIIDRNVQALDDQRFDDVRFVGDGLLNHGTHPPLIGGSLFQDTGATGSAEWLAALDRLRALHYEKTAQYGGADDAFENVTASAKCGVEPWRRALCDLSDCVVRMQKYAQGQPVDPTNALLDAANWALICLIKMESAKQATERL